jgi:germination protein M
MSYRTRNNSRRHQARIAAGTGTAIAVTLLLLALALAALTGCGSANPVGDAGPAVTAAATTTAVGPAETTTGPSPDGGSSAGTSPPPSTTVPADATTTLPSGATMTVSVFFSANEKIAVAHRAVAKTQEVGEAAIKALLGGPSTDEKTAGMSTCIPAGTTFLGLEIKDAIATVNLSKEFASGGGSLSMATRLAQVVYTLTQFVTVGKVDFQLDGEPVSVFGGEGIILDHPVGRADYEELTPAIFIESPAAGDTVSSPLRIWGTANVFEGRFEVQLNSTRWDALIHPTTVFATAGTGTRGTFDITIPFLFDKAFNGPNGILGVASFSPKDGSPINASHIPVRLEP